MMQSHAENQPLPILTAESGITVRGWIVLAMVTVAVVGAIAAFRSAKTEQDAAILVHKLAEGQLFELTMQQRVVSETLTRGMLDLRATAILRDGQRFMSTAASVRKSDPRYADWLELRAQEEFAAWRTIASFRYEFSQLVPDAPARPLTLDTELTKWEMIQQQVAGKLTLLGFETTWCDPRYDPTPEDETEAGGAAANPVLTRTEDRSNRSGVGLWTESRPCMIGFGATPSL